MTELYLIYRKRDHTTNIRMRDQVGPVIAERTKRPLAKLSGYGMKKVSWWTNSRPCWKALLKEYNGDN